MSVTLLHTKKKGGFRPKIIIAGLLGCLVVILATGYFTGIWGRAQDLETNARLIKPENSATVYYVSPAGLKLPFPSAKIFLSYGYSWASVETVSAQEAAFYDDAAFISLGKNSSAYYLDNGVKRYVSSATLKALKIDSSKILTVNRTQFKAYSTGMSMALNEAREKYAAAAGREKVLEAQDANCVPDTETGGASGCTIFYALQTGNEKLCEDIVDQTWKANCYSAFIASGRDNWQSCYKLSDNVAQYSCFRFAAVTAKDSQLCNYINDKKIKNKCVADVGVANKDINGCASLTIAGQKDDADTCYFNFALLNKDFNACYKISKESQYKTNCESLVSASNSVAVKTRNNSNWSGRAAYAISKIFGGGVAKAAINIGDTQQLVGGRFLPGFFDIYTPTLCGPLVSVAGAYPGVFVFTPTYIYDDFYKVFNHVGTNTVGLARVLPVCPPSYYFLGSSPGVFDEDDFIF